MNSLRSLFVPAGIAVVGASEKVNKIRGRLLKLLIDGGYQGKIYPVNPSSEVIQGLPAYPNVTALPQVPDLALVAVPAGQVMQVLEECAAIGVKAAAVFSAGAASDPVGSRLQDKVAEFSQRTGMRVLGPNAEGFIDTISGVIATFSPTMQMSPPVKPQGARQGYVSIVSQSGAMAFALYSRACAQYLPIGHLVSTGNEADVECAEVIDYLIDEGSSKAILLFLEGFKNPARFVEVAQKAASAGIPIIVAKVGKSTAGQRATVSHTAHLAGSDMAYDAIFSRYGVIRVDDPEEMIALGSVVSTGAMPKGKRVAIITTSGGAGGWAADICEEAGLSVPELHPDFKTHLRSIIPDYGSAENPVDVTASVVEDGGVTLLAILKEVASIEGIDIALVIVSLVSPERLGQIETPLTTLLSGSTRPMLFHSPGTPHESASRILMQAGSAQLNLPVFARAMQKLADYSHFVARDRHRSSEPKRPGAANPYHTDLLADTDALLDAYAIPRPAEKVVTSASEAVAQARRIGYPVALKVISEQVPHKTEAGALALSLSADEQVAQAFEQVIANARNFAGDPSIDTVLVQKMMPPGRELMVGGIMDPDFGPMVMLGFGGIYVEILRDVTLAPAPLNLQDAHAMIDQLKGSSLLRGARGEAASDLNALANLLVATSRLLLDAAQDIDELDFNPVIVYPEGQGVAVVDSLIVRKSAAAGVLPPVSDEQTTIAAGG
ncbi:MAG TPA: acetate--CoA ligase family protein [Advenella sp.]|nr:acetate--CoA ligase family protein [Advenella sp.]